MIPTSESWVRSSFCDTGNCVEVQHEDGYFHLRSNVNGSASPALAFTPVEWAAFVAGVKAGEFDL
jgi:hypothetical protein